MRLCDAVRVGVWDDVLDTVGECVPLRVADEVRDAARVDVDDAVLLRVGVATGVCVDDEECVDSGVLLTDMAAVWVEVTAAEVVAVCAAEEDADRLTLELGDAVAVAEKLSVGVGVSVAAPEDVELLLAVVVLTAVCDNVTRLLNDG